MGLQLERSHFQGLYLTCMLIGNKSNRARDVATLVARGNGGGAECPVGRSEAVWVKKSRSGAPTRSASPAPSAAVVR